MTYALVLPALAGVVAVVIALTRRLPQLLVETSVTIPSARVLSMTVLGSRFVAFACAYVLLFGAAVWVGTTRDGPDDEKLIVAAAGVVAAILYLVVSAVTFLAADPHGPVLLGALGVGGGSVAVGVKLAVVTVAGLAIGDRW